MKTTILEYSGSVSIDSFISYYNLVKGNYKALGTYNAIQKVAELAGLIELGELHDDINSHSNSSDLIIDPVTGTIYQIHIELNSMAESLRGLL